MIHYLFSALLVILSCTFVEAQKVDKRTHSLKIMKEYSPESYTLIKRVEELKKNKPKGVMVLGSTDFTKWISSNKVDQILDDISTAVHETCHAYTFRHPIAVQGGFGEEASSFYIDERTTVYVPHTELFNSFEMAEVIPEELRTDRYGVYLSSKSMLSAQRDGPYGLMNEWNAYMNGTRMSIQLYRKYQKRADEEGAQIYLDYLSNVNNILLAHYEFEYFILHYLKYAQRNYPKIYRKILSNDAFIEAFNLIHARFEELVSQHEANKQAITVQARQAGLRVKEDQRYFYIGNRGVGNFKTDYVKLKRELQKSEYEALMVRLLHSARS